MKLNTATIWERKLRWPGDSKHMKKVTSLTSVSWDNGWLTPFLLPSPTPCSSFLACSQLRESPLEPWENSLPPNFRWGLPGGPLPLDTQAWGSLLAPSCTPAHFTLQAVSSLAHTPKGRNSLQDLAEFPQTRSAATRIGRSMHPVFKIAWYEVHTEYTKTINI